MTKSIMPLNLSITIVGAHRRAPDDRRAIFSRRAPYAPPRFLS
ncbi:hypothetical protein [Coleofasciculus sp. F4-SAH-05]